MIDILFNRILEISLSGTVIVFIITILKVFFKKILSARWHYLIWLLLIIRLILPFDFESNLSIMPQINIQNEHMNTSSIMMNSDEETEEPEVETRTYYDNIKNPVSMNINFSLLWLTISSALFLSKLIMEVLFYIKQKENKELTNPMVSKILKDLKISLGIHRDIRIYMDTTHSVPRVYGLIKPRITISQEVFYASNEDQLRHIILHELSHIKQMDLWINLLRHLLMCIYFFNPILVWGLKRMAVDGEVSCDERVLNTLSNKNQIAYGYTLIHLISQSNPKSNMLALSLGSKKNVTRRLKMISNYKRIKKSRQILGVLLAGIISIITLSVPVVSAQEYNISNAIETRSFFIFNDDPGTASIEKNDHEALDFIRPLENAYITSSFGKRSHPVDGSDYFHKGTDFAASKGTDIVASEAGSVIYSDYSDGYGKTVIIQHADGYETLYAHCDQLFVEIGEYVEKGQVIASVGNTGRSTGPHLHFEVHKDDTYLDPETIINQ